MSILGQPQSQQDLLDTLYFIQRRQPTLIPKIIFRNAVCLFRNHSLEKLLLCLFYNFGSTKTFGYGGATGIEVFNVSILH